MVRTVSEYSSKSSYKKVTQYKKQCSISSLEIGKLNSFCEYVCERERKRARERGREGKWERERGEGMEIEGEGKGERRRESEE